jgi:protocatechuate 3,4-dioxygenase beta subunit
MSSTSQALKRLGVGSVTVATVLAMPYVGVASAFAAAADATVTITSQQTADSSPRNDGTDTTVKVSANVLYTPSTPADPNQPAGVKFSYTPSLGLPVVIGTDSTAPYSIAWTPPTGGGAFTLTAQAVLANGSATGTPGSQTTTVVDAPSVHITSPAEGGSIGAFGGFIAVSGTRSADLPALSVKAATRNNTTGALTSYGAATPVAATTGGANWNAAVAVPNCLATSPATCDVVIYAATTTAGVASDEVTEATEYAQTLASSTVAPASATVPAGSSQNYTDTVLDQNGKPVAGLTVAGTSSNTAVAPNPGSTTTDGLGVASFSATTAATPVGSTTLTFRTQTVPGTYNALVDFSRTASLTTYASTPTSATLTAAPSNALFAQQSEYPPVTTPGTGFPIVKFCVVDQNGNSTPAGVGQAPVLTDSRRDSTLAATAASIVEPVTVTAISGTGCYQLGLPAATGTYGTDTISGYFEQNGTPGQQAGDPSATPLVLNYGNLAITGLNTQAQKGTAVTVSFKVLDANNRPFANRVLTLTTSAAGTFTAAQPSGTSVTPPAGSNGVAAANTLFGTTDANGIVSATVNSATAGPVTVTAADSITSATQIASGAAAGTAVVDFRTSSVALATLAQTSYTITTPSGATTSNVTTASPAVRPGDVVQYTYQLQDANAAGGNVLANTPVVLSLDHGFFTPNCTGATAVTSGTDPYSKCTADPAAADGAKVGTLKSLGQSVSLTSDPSGNVTFSVAIGRDVLFDQAGVVNATLTGVANGGTKAAANKVAFTTAGITPINGGAVKIVGAAATPANANKVSGDVVASTGTNFVVHLTDQFGNLLTVPTGSAIPVTVTGGGTLSKASTVGSFLTIEDAILLKSTTTSTAGQSNTVTATWTAPVTTYKASTSGTPAVTTFAVATPTTTTVLTDSFTVNLYAVDTAALTYSFASTPGNSVPVNTAVTTSVTVKDQKGNPVQNLCVNFLRSGPNDAAGNSQTGGTTFGCVPTNVSGKAGTSYSSGTPGTATVTVIVTDGASGNELSRGVQNVTFTKGTPAGGITINATKGTIIAGQLSTIVVTGTPGVAYDVIAANRPSSVFALAHQGIIGVNGTASFTVHPLNNVNFIARQSGAASPQIIIAVHTGLNIGVKKSGHTLTFYGQIYPNNRSQTVYIYAVGQSSPVGAATRDASGKNWTFTHNFSSGAGKTVTFYSYTLSDTQNANGHSAYLKAVL